MKIHSSHTQNGTYSHLTLCKLSERERERERARVCKHQNQVEYGQKRTPFRLWHTTKNHKKIYKTINRNIVYMHAVSNIHNRNIRIGDKVSECFVRFSDNTVSNRSWIGLGRWYRFFFFFCRTVVISPIARRLDGFFSLSISLCFTSLV